MARYEHSKEKRSFRDSTPRRGKSRSFGEVGKSRKFSDRGTSRYDKSNSSGFQKTRVTCSACGKDCEVPFKPTTSKPLFCDDCFANKNDSGYNNRSSGSSSNHEFDIINEKLNKIMKALKID